MSRRTFLRCIALEDRACPTTAVYTADTATLTVTGTGIGQVVVSGLPGYPAGYLKVTDGGTVFSSATGGRPVRNLVVTFAGSQTGDLTLLPDVSVGGTVTVYGAPKATVFSCAGSVGGALRYFAGPTGNDFVTLNGPNVGRGAYLGLGGGANTLNLNAGLIGASLAVQAGAGDDTVNLLGTGDLTVGGAAAFQLGGGTNRVETKGNHVFHIGKSLAYAGGAGEDDLNWLPNGGSQLVVGGGVIAALGGGPNQLAFDALTVGGGLAVTGGAGVDSVAFCDDTAVGGGVNLALGEDGADVLVGHLGAGPVTVGGNFTVRTGAKSDNLDLEWLTVGGNLTLNVGAADPGFFQQVLVGTTGSHPVRVQGSFALTSGAGFDDFHLARLSVGGGMTIATGGGSDGITVDDTAVAGATVIDLGDGYDHLQVDNQDQDGAGSLSADTAFGGSVTVRAGAQDDKVELSAAGGTRVRFGGRATFRGGNGTDTLANWIGNAFLATGNSQDFETYTGPALQ